MKIALMTEGTYPFAFGGVSVWCDQLIRGMPGYDFHVVALVAHGGRAAGLGAARQRRLDGQVAAVGAAAGARGHRGGAGARRTPGPVAAPADRDPARLPRGCPADRFAGVLRELHEYSSQRGYLSASLASDRAIRLLAGAWRDRWPQDGRPPDGRSVPTLHDAVTALQLLDHSLRPLCYAAGPGGPRARGGQRAGRAAGAGREVAARRAGAAHRARHLPARAVPAAPQEPVPVAGQGALPELSCASSARPATRRRRPSRRATSYNRRWEERLGAEPSRIRTVYNGVDPANFPAVDGEPGVPTISWVGPDRSDQGPGNAAARVRPGAQGDPGGETAAVRIGAARAARPTCSVVRRSPPNSASPVPRRSRAGSRTSATPTRPVASWCCAASPRVSLTA